LLLCTLGGLIAGIFVVPAAYRQYYLMPLAISCLLAATGFCFVVDVLLGPARERARTWLVVGAIAPLLVLPVVDLARSHAQRNDYQLGRLRFVLEHTSPTDTVLDGWLGTGVFRPHALYYFFMHREVLAMLSDEEKDAYLAPLESGRVRPSMIALDVELVALGPRFVHFLRSNYVSHNGLFYFPKQDR